ncbi:MAG: AAA family ATPase [Deltaproteobacteria bacterium]|jgi:hypothetical protein|nr:AAA family ATPase [Deltaproteobacteria bacterium]
MTKLPSTKHSFRFLRENNILYVDKTKFIYHLTKINQACLLARPPLFGKSLLVGALIELFEGNRELFKALWIDQSDYDFEPRPYVHLDFNKLTARGLDFFRLSLGNIMATTAGQNGLKATERDNPMSVFNDLVAKIYHQNGHGQVAVLIDGYDAAVMKLLARKPKTAVSVWERLRAFYQNIRLNEQVGLVLFMGQGHLDFGHLEGRPEVLDLSFEPSLANCCGFSEDEFGSTFATHFNPILNKLIDDELISPSATTRDLLKLLSLTYGGFTWNGTDQLLNPYSMVSFIKKMAFTPRWTQVTNRGLVNHLLRRPPDLLKILGKQARLSPLSWPHQPQDLSAEQLMFQHGYLSPEGPLTNEPNSQVKLYFPNLEVKHLILPYLLNLRPLGLSMLELQALGQAFRKALFDGSAGEMEDIFLALGWLAPSGKAKEIFESGKNLVLYLLALSGQSLRPLDWEPFSLALSSHEVDEPDYDGHHLLMAFRFLKNPTTEMAQIEDEKYPLTELQSALEQKLRSTYRGSKALTLTACSIIMAKSLANIKVIIKKL